MVNKSESKYFNTAVRMDEALLTLLEQKDFRYITVKEICDMAGVNRSTFYLHYETLGDLLSETVEYIMKRFNNKFASFEKIGSEQIAGMPLDKLILITPEYLIPYLEFVKENRCVFKVAVTQPSAINVNSTFSRFYSDVFYPIMKRFNADDLDISYKLTFYLHGMSAVITQWLQNDCSEEVEAMADLIIRCVFPKRDLPL